MSAEAWVSQCRLYLVPCVIQYNITAVKIFLGIDDLMLRRVSLLALQLS